MTASGEHAAATRRARNRHGSGDLLRQELIDAAGRLLAVGTAPDELSLRAVAREAGVAAPSVYLQFESRDALVDAVVAAHFRELAAEVQASYEGVTAPYQRLLLGCEAYLRFAETNPGAYRIIFESAIPVLDPCDLTGRDVFQLLVDGVASCLPHNEEMPARAFSLACDIWVAMHGMVTLRRQLPLFPWPDVGRQLERIIRLIVPPADAAYRSISTAAGR